MNIVTRRDAVFGGMFALATGLATSPDPAAAAEIMRIPQRPMRLTRWLSRGLRGGNVLTVERAWRVEFAQQADGIRISGQQLSAKVTAPEKLAALARIEEARSTADFFPILLREDGRIQAAGRAISESDLAAALTEAEAVISRRPLSVAAKQEQMTHLNELQQTATSLLQQIPADLFFPVTPPSHVVRSINLPDGLIGEFEITYEARTAPGAAWLAHSERKVITRIGPSERQSSETWSLTEI